MVFLIVKSNRCLLGKGSENIFFVVVKQNHQYCERKQLLTFCYISAVSKLCVRVLWDTIANSEGSSGVGTKDFPSSRKTHLYNTTPTISWKPFTVSALDHTTFLSMTLYFCQTGFSVIAEFLMIKNKKWVVCGTGNEGSGVQLDFKIWSYTIHNRCTHSIHKLLGYLRRK